MTLPTFLSNCSNVLALVGAGLSAPSGIPTFTGDGKYWRGIESKGLATRSAFVQDPDLVWQFYEERRQQAMSAYPNRGHIALTHLANVFPQFLAITQNIDGLSERAGHKPSALAALHGSLFTAKCSNAECQYTTLNAARQPLVPALGLSRDHLNNPTEPPRRIPYSDLPACPRCRQNLLRPGIVCFGEQLPLNTLDQIDRWLEMLPRIDLMLVVGTSARVFPAAEYITQARRKGAFIAHFNLDRNDDWMEPGDWFIPGDASITLPSIVDEAFSLASRSREAAL